MPYNWVQVPGSNLFLIISEQRAVKVLSPGLTNANEPKFGWHDNEVYDVTTRTLGDGPMQYLCDAAASVCLYEDASLSTPIDESEGEFRPGSGLTTIENQTRQSIPR
ncbi:hypothetical protein LZF95_09885 [Algoriphagus sp. AGSA1]|uniref:hypothetical protein n=1 Tax=Algoriphagus sp. AGSA1 TaxID=2907213 RepID=UPI001F2C0C67|nr:hypothetical protein [Algoriphagus sp. AGSA1]MCE7054983.1 hypothetical protein [Algoriphagus sp. AGSA1]